VKEKPARPWGRRVDPATGLPGPYLPAGAGREENAVSAEKRVRAIVAVGYQDLDIREAVPLDPGARFEGLSSDCCVFDVTESEKTPRPGDRMRFSLKYHAMAQAMASPTVEKIILL